MSNDDSDTINLALQRAMTLAVAVTNTRDSPDDAVVGFGSSEVDVVATLGFMLEDELRSIRETLERANAPKEGPAAPSPAAMPN